MACDCDIDPSDYSLLWQAGDKNRVVVPGWEVSNTLLHLFNGRRITQLAAQNGCSGSIAESYLSDNNRGGKSGHVALHCKKILFRFNSPEMFVQQQEAKL
jgi:hypothetical protein